MLSAVLFMLAAGAVPAAAEAAVDVPEPNPKAMSRSEIRAFNAKLSRTHPYYIRCERTEDIGSLVKRSYSCRTNAQWHKAEAIGNQNARDAVESMQSKAVNTSG
jgi:hypothetical protein